VMFESKSPIDVVVDRVAAAVAKAWDQARSEQTPASNEEEAAFLAIAYRYLSERQAAVYKLERTQHLRDVQQRYRAPPSADQLYGGFRESYDIVEVLGMIFVTACVVGLLFAAVNFLGFIVQNIGVIIEGLKDFLVSGQALMLVLFTALPLIVTIISEHLFSRQHQYVFAGFDGVHWEALQAHSSKQIESERAQILAMIGSSSAGGTNAPTISDPDLPAAKENPVPIQPGITEYVSLRIA
jgi:hypothetical protein